MVSNTQPVERDLDAGVRKRGVGFDVSCVLDREWVAPGGAGSRYPNACEVCCHCRFRKGKNLLRTPNVWKSLSSFAVSIVSAASLIDIAAVPIEMNDMVRLAIGIGTTKDAPQLLKRGWTEHVKLEPGASVFAEPFYQTACNAEWYIVASARTADHKQDADRTGICLWDLRDLCRRWLSTHERTGTKGSGVSVFGSRTSSHGIVVASATVVTTSTQVSLR